MPTLLIATTNPGKVREIIHEFEVAAQTSHDPSLSGIDIRGLRDLTPAPADCIEDRPTFIGNATKKARHFAETTGCLTLADDSGLCVEALAGAPGVISARYAGVDGPREVVDPANNAKLMREMEGVPEGRRQAKFVCAMALAMPGAELAVMVDEVRGEILREPRGEHGFGYDPYFYFPEFGKTTAELDMETKSRISHRGKALRRMIGWLGARGGSLLGF